MVSEQNEEKEREVLQDLEKNESTKKSTSIAINEERLKKFKERAHQHHLQNERKGRMAKNSVMGFMGKRLRLFAILAIQVLVIGMVLEYFVFGQEKGSIDVKRFNRVHKKGELPYQVMGEEARQFKNCREVKDTVYASVVNFPEESVFARDLQMQMVGRQRLPLELENSIGMRFRMIPAPKNKVFMMGSREDEEGRGANEVLHEVPLKGSYYMGKYEVTQKEWEEVRFKWDKIRKDPVLLEEAKKLGTIPERLIRDGLAPNPSFYSMKFHNLLPINNVTWYEAYYFGIALSAIEGVKIGTYRIPLEREWEWACRGGSPYAYAWGKDASLMRYFDHFGRNSYYRLAIVGKGLPNAYGLYNMHGNVYEWCYDVFRIYPGAPPDAYDGITRVIRGGNYRLDADSCRCAERMRLGENSHGSVLGFRLMRIAYDGVYERSMDTEALSLSEYLEQELEQNSQRLTTPTETAGEEAKSENRANSDAAEIGERRE